MAEAYGKLRGLSCSQNVDNPQDQSMSCDIMLDNGHAEVVEDVSEVEVDGDVQLLHNSYLGETHVTPNETLYVAEQRGKLMVKHRNDFIEQETGLSVHRG